MFGFTKAALAVAVLASSAAGQESFFDTPQQAWAQAFGPMLDNNGLVLSPDDSILFATSATGGVAAMKRDDGSIIWSDLLETGFSNGEVTFSPNFETIYYPVSTLATETCTVYAKTATTGEDVWTSPELAGVCEGSVHVTSDGENVFVIYNSDTGTIGHFTVLDNTGVGIYTYDDTIGPFSPMGIYGEPSPDGNYPAGTGNTNTFAVWGYKPTPTATVGESGGSFGFQMPLPASLANVTVLIPYNSTDWRATAPPLLTSMGQQMFWCVSRSKLRSWSAVSFNQNADGGFEFLRGDPTYVGASYTPAVNDIDNPTLVCGGAANSSFSCMEPTGNPYTFTWQVPTKAIIQANPFFSPGADRVYFFDSAGDWFAVNPTTGEVLLTAPTGVSIQANTAMTSDGAYIFFGDSTGNVVAWQIADSTLPDVTIPDAGGDGGDGSDGEESVFPNDPDTSPPSEAPKPSASSQTPSAPTAPTSAPASGVVGMSVFSVIAASAVAAVTLF